MQDEEDKIKVNKFFFVELYKDPLLAIYFWFIFMSYVLGKERAWSCKR